MKCPIPTDGKYYQGRVCNCCDGQCRACPRMIGAQKTLTAESICNKLKDYSALVIRYLSDIKDANSLLPDFSSVPETGNCFSVLDGYSEYEIHDGRIWSNNTWYLYNGSFSDTDKHPTLFHSYEQFKAYWEEQERSMKEAVK